MKEHDGLNYCCDSFWFFATAHKTRSPDIRILRVVSPSPQWVATAKSRKFHNNPLAFTITLGYSGNYMDDDVIANSISYCPFCGKNLHKFYRDLRYANEIVDYL